MESTKFSRKGQIEDWLPSITLVVFLVFLFFFLILPNTANPLQGASAFSSLKIDSGMALADYLKSNAELEGFQNPNMADAIGYYFASSDENILAQIKAKTKQLFSGSLLESDSASWSIEIKNAKSSREIAIDSEKIEAMRKNPGKAYIKSRDEVADSVIPGSSSNASIEIRLFAVSLG